MNFSLKLSNVDFTAKMEENLDLIEEGKVDWIEIIDDFYQDFKVRLRKQKKR